MVALHKYEILNSEIVEGERTYAKERQRLGGGDKRSPAARAAAAARAEKSLGQRIDQPIRDQSKRTDAKLAAVTGTNRQYVADVRKIAAVKPQALEEIEAGKKTVPQVRRETTIKRPAPRPPLRCDCCGRIVSAVTFCRDCGESICDDCEVEHAGMWRPGRNSPCPCGSGLKYKRCCGRLGGPRISAAGQS